MLSLVFSSVWEKALDPMRIDKKRVEIFFIPFLFYGWVSSRVYKNRKGLNVGFVLPCAGIILIRFYGFDLSPGINQSTPGTMQKYGMIVWLASISHKFIWL